MRNTWIVSSFLLFSYSLSFAAPIYINAFLRKDILVRKLQRKFDPPKFSATHAFDAPFSAVTTGYFHQKLDHYAPQSLTTFAQRYFINSSFANSPHAPVFLYICGEATCDPALLNGLPTELARKFKGHIVALEHRYYGASQPFEELTDENIKYLTTDYALRDLNFFQEKLTERLSLKGPWVAIGGSYAGNLAAFYRQKYPHRVVGAIASSAPVQARQNFEEYDLQAYKAVGPECAAKIRSVITQAETAIKEPKEFEALRKKLNATSLTTPTSFVSFVGMVGFSAVQRGTSSALCTRLANEPPLKVYADLTKGLLNDSADAKDAALEVLPTADPLWAETAPNTKPINTANESIAWAYQTCKEYGYFMPAYHDRKQSLQSSLITLDMFFRSCKSMFNQPASDSEMINGRYFYQMTSPNLTNIYFVNGSKDPWRVLSILDNRFNKNLETSVLPGYAHCSDLSYISSFQGDFSQEELRKNILSSVEKWLTQNLARE